MADVFEIDVDETLDGQWHRVIGIKFHTRKVIEPHPCVGRHKRPEGLIRNWSITTDDDLVIGMTEINRYTRKPRGG